MADKTWYNTRVMNILVNQILENKEAAALPGLLESGGLPALVSGLSAVHRANLAAALRDRSGRPLFVLCPDDTAAENMAGDLSAMLREPVVTIGMRDFTFYPAEAASRQAEQKRLAALYALAEGTTPIAVASVSGLMQRTMPPETLRRAAFTIEDTGSYAVEDIEDALLRCGYVRTVQVEGPGQFARRGGILDFFSPADHEPVRVEFWGDEIDSMSFFDVGDQRRTETVRRCTILPAAETLPSLSTGGIETLCREIEETAARFARKRTSENAATLAATLRGDAERLRAGVVLSDADRYLPMIYAPACGFDYIPADALLMLDQPARCAERARDFLKQLGEDLRELQKKGQVASAADSFCTGWDTLLHGFADFPVYMADAFTVGRPPLAPRTLVSIPAKQLPSYAGSAQAAAEDVKLYLKQDFRIVVLAGDERRAKVLQDFLREHEIRAMLYPELTKLPAYGGVSITIGALSAGIEYPGLKLAILTDAQLIRRRNKKQGTRKKLPANRQRIESYADLSVGDYVVHENHGIGRFAGIVKMTVDGFEKDYIKISYAGTDSLYVPATQLDLVSKYTGGGEERPVKLSKMGGADWAKTRSRAKSAAKDMAKKLIALYAERQRLPGYAFAPDSEWQREFEENFGYTETDDQLRCTAEIKQDMESSVPMDRLLCGDVGFGKTEVALRAVMKCVLDGKQAAILVPTTVLAQQHYQTALQRFFGFPVNIAVLSRFKTGGQSSKTLAELQQGKIDLIIGTHRLLSKDVKFKDLGLLVVDEEQRFGVTHKEHIKELSRGVDVLTLSATPIPRTLNMAMSGIRDMSSIEEPPEDRLPVQTFVMEHDWGVITDAIRREIQRGGQVYYLHNRIDDIDRTAMRLQDMLKDVTVAVAHGKMDKNMLASVMDEVASGQVQVLVCTTIIETGIDIPNVNTLIIEDADKLGLAQLHQIRGRVGRSTRRASAYLTFRRDKVLTEIAEKRLSAIRDFAAFGSGFKIAMRDLEIRGAGNLLGAEQSGHMIDVGYDMYMKLLSEAVLEARGVPVQQRADCSADLAVAANIPERYIPSSEQRMDVYRRIALIRTEEEADDLTDELIDRFGDPPPGVNALIHVALLRGEAGRAGITDIAQKQGYLRFTVENFDMEKVSALYAQPAYKGRLRVEAGSKPCLSLRIKAKGRVIDEARRFVADWAERTNVS
ncbi:MAG: transcription-repair coupling factor [Eubacteriales bacterium]|nr:transcription-repair coupling factor [Eubacteriales bacterium]